ncbi:hypothetical protein [Proteus mirabilis]|uniref:hypothetical protein n=1 Tax=Proteus mirabilis TaxID=584 RepID=UPI0034D63B2E
MKYKIALSTFIILILIGCIVFLNFHAFPRGISRVERTLILIVIEITLIVLCTISKGPSEYAWCTIVVPVLTIIFSDPVNGLIVGIPLMVCIIFLSILLKKTYLSIVMKPVDGTIVDKIIQDAEVQQRKFDISKIRFHGENDE